MHFVASNRNSVKAACNIATDADEVTVVRDIVAPRKILTAIHEAYHAIRVME